MSPPLVPTNPTELSALHRRARRLVDAVSDLITHGQHSYASFQARVEADRPAKDNREDRFVNLYLWRVLVNDPPPCPRFNGCDVQVQFATGAVPFRVYILNRLLHHLQVDHGQLEDAQRGQQRQDRRRVGTGKCLGRTSSACSRLLWAPCRCRSYHLGPITITITITSTYSIPQWNTPRCNTISHTTTHTRLSRFTSITMFTNMWLSTIHSGHSRRRSQRRPRTWCRLPVRHHCCCC